MLDEIREHSGSWLIKVALGAIVLVFIFWGFGAGKMGGGGDSFAAKVNGQEIPLQTYEQLYRNREAQRRSQGKNLNPELDEKFLSQQVMDDLIEDELLLQYADEAGIYVSPQELADEIKKQPFLQDEKTHEFIGRDKYLAFLKDRDIDVGEFEKDVERSTRISKAREFIENSVKISPTELKDEFKARSEKVTLSYVRIDPLALAASMKNAAISAADIAAWTKANPGKVEAIYAEEKDARYTTPAKAELLQITVRKPAPDATAKDAGDALASAKRRSERALELAATDWTKAADQYSEGAPWEKSGSARELSRRELPVAVADKVFAMKPGDAPALVETPTSWTIVKVKSVTPEKVTELDETVKKAIVEDEIRKQRATDEVAKVAQQVYDGAKTGQALEKIAKPLGLAVKETGGFPKRDEIPGIPESNATMVAQAFQLKKPGDVLGDAPVKAGNGFVVAVLKDHVLPNDADFDKQKGWIEFSLKRAKSTAVFNSWKADALAKAKVTENPRLIRG